MTVRFRGNKSRTVSSGNADMAGASTISRENLASDVIAHANAHATITLGVYHLLPNSTHTSWHVSCIPEAYLVHRSEGGEVENLDINLYISTFLTIMNTMYTLYTF